MIPWDGLEARPVCSWMRLILVILLIQKCCASNVDFIPSPTFNADVVIVVRCMRKLSDARLPLLIQKCGVSNVEFILSPTQHAGVDSVDRRIRKLADAGLPPCATSVDRFRYHTCDVYAVRVITVIGIMKAA